MADRFCPKCGAGRQPGMPYCAHCGLNFADVGPSSTNQGADAQDHAEEPRTGSFGLINAGAIVVGIAGVAVFVWVVFLTRGGAVLPSPTESEQATPSPVPITHDLNGQVVLEDYASEGLAFGPKCWGVGFFDDINVGTRVTVSDAQGVLIGTGSLTEGNQDDPGDGFGCVFKYSVRHLPDAAFYTIEIANRPGPSYALADLESVQWTVTQHFYGPSS
jgi:hypothetical protein